MVKIKVPQEIKMGAHRYTVSFKPNLRADDGFDGTANHRTQEIQLEPKIADTLKASTFLHEIIHIGDKMYGCHLPEDDVERIAQVMMDFLVNTLGIELDWSNIEACK